MIVPDIVSKTDNTADEIVDDVIQLVDTWLDAANQNETRAEKKSMSQLSGVVSNPADMAFALRFVDRVIRPESNRVAASQLVALVNGGELPSFVSPIDKALLWAGAKLAPALPEVVIPLAKRRMRSLVGHLVVDAEDVPMTRHLRRRHDAGFALNVNPLGEAVLGNAEAARRLDEAEELLGRSDVDYVSIKLSSMVAQINPWDFDGSLDRVTVALRRLFQKAAASSPPTFLNLDMEEYHDLELTMTAFMTVLDEPEFHTLTAGIVIQTYLPDSFAALQQLETWATKRKNLVLDGSPGGEIKVRLVKGANLAMERVDAAIHDWELATYGSKAETDANFKRCIDWVFHPDRLTGLRIGIASHNLFDIAFAKLLSERRNVTKQIEFEMLEGMAPTHSRLIRDQTGMLLYTPIVAEDDFDVAISYLFRRLEENASDENFVHHLFSMTPGSNSAQKEARQFKEAIRTRWDVRDTPNRTQDRNQVPLPTELTRFENAPDTDPSLGQNRSWAKKIVATQKTGPKTSIVDDSAVVDKTVAVAQTAQREWGSLDTWTRRTILWNVGNEIEARRADLIAAMVNEANKTVAEADVEVSEAIDFARYYGDQALKLEGLEHAKFESLGVILIAPPWNFPVAIPAGGITAALAAGNSVIVKPAPETPLCSEIVAECCWAGGVPGEALQYVRVPDNETGRHLVSHHDVDALILTGAYETADLFRSWKPDIRIFAETSGKNALIVTPNADLDLAVADLAASAFGHAGQKCSAASLAILVGDVFTSDRFRRQLIDAVSSLAVGRPTELASKMGPTITEPTGKLLRALTELEDGEKWLLEPRQLDSNLWTPGIRDLVAKGSWFQQTECFGPVLGLMQADSLEEAIAIQNANDFGLTGGIHSLDHNEIELWLKSVHVGNAYVNRPTTGAIVQRQPFGGWKRSSIGPGAKAGGPNYVAQLGTWTPDNGRCDAAELLRKARESDIQAWKTEFSIEHDPTDLFCESNRFRYMPLELVAIRLEGEDTRVAKQRLVNAADICGTKVVVSEGSKESADEFATRLKSLAPERIRVVGPVDPAIRTVSNTIGANIIDGPVTAQGRVEMLAFLREQSISETTHRYGNVLQ